MKKAWDSDRWIFRAEERSNLVWEVTADDQQGTVIERTVTDDPDEGMRQVRAEAAELTRRRRAADV